MQHASLVDNSSPGVTQGRLLTLAVIAAVVALIGGVVMSSMRASPTADSSGGQSTLPLVWVRVNAPAQSWYPADYQMYSPGIAIRSGTAPAAECASGNACGSIVVMSKRACPTALTLDVDVTQGLGGAVIGNAHAELDSISPRQPVVLQPSMPVSSTSTGLVGSISGFTCS
jgi:hypothetical protein